MCKMEIWYEQLEQVNQDIVAQSAVVKAALEARLNADNVDDDDYRKLIILKEAYDNAKEKEDQLLQVKYAILAKAPSPGEPTLLQNDVSSIKQCGTN